MSLLEQTIQLLTEAPGNLVYHLVTLLALQVLFALSRSQWRRDPLDQMARRMAWSAGLIFLLRAALLLVGVLLSGSPSRAALLIPPLEMASQTVAAVLIVWALVIHPVRFPRLGDTLLLIVLLVVGVMTIFFVQGWQETGGGAQPYYESQQAIVWSVLQITLLGFGTLLAFGAKTTRNTLNPIIVFLLLMAHIANVVRFPDSSLPETEIAYWIRLGHLIAFPLMAAVAYRRTLLPLLLAQQASQPLSTVLGNSLSKMTKVIGASNLEDTIRQGIDAVAQVIEAKFVGFVLFSGEDRRQVRLVSNLPQSGQDGPRSWVLVLDDWPVFRMGIDQREGLQLVPNGLGARQLHGLYEELEIPSFGAMLINPPSNVESALALLLVAGPPKGYQWSERESSMAGVLADYVAQAIENQLTDPRTERQNTLPSGSEAANSEVSGRIIALEDERSKLMKELRTTRSRLQRAEGQAATSSQQARDLAATLEELDQLKQGGQIPELKSEIDALRESLIEAEEAMALAAAGDSGLSTEWVMLTITRYSGQLEEAQARIQSLESELEHWERGPVNQVVASLAQELRTPMTSIAGYSDLLLGERMGVLGELQRDFVQRIKANSERMGVLLEQIVQMTTQREQSAPPTMAKELVDVREVIEIAVNTVMTQIREKQLYVDLDIADDLPRLHINRRALSQIVASLLGNACQSSDSHSRVAVAANVHAVPIASSNGHKGMMEFLKMTVSDSGGGIRAEDRSRVFDPHHRADSPLIAGLGDTGVALSVARALTEENGGRIWVDSDQGVGSTFSTLFPIVAPEVDGGDADGLNEAHVEQGDV
jgi:signal transduction histidine kinase